MLKEKRLNMPSTQHPVYRVYNVSFCDDHPEDYRRCPEDGLCRPYVACSLVADQEPETGNTVNIEMTVTVSAVVLCLIVFIGVTVFYRLKRRQDGPAESETVVDQVRHRETRLTPAVMSETDRIRRPETDSWTAECDNKTGNDAKDLPQVTCCKLTVESGC